MDDKTLGSTLTKHFGQTGLQQVRTLGKYCLINETDRCNFS